MKKQKKEKLDRLQIKLKNLGNIHKKKQNQRIKMELDKAKNEIYSNEIKRKLIFLKETYYEAEGKSAKLLAYKLKKQQADSTIYKVKDPITNSLCHKLTAIQQ